MFPLVRVQASCRSPVCRVCAVPQQTRLTLHTLVWHLYLCAYICIPASTRNRTRSRILHTQLRHMSNLWRWLGVVQWPWCTMRTKLSSSAD